MKFNPHDYQLDAIRWLMERPAAGLFLPPGLGKTSIVLSAITVLLQHGIIDKVLIIAPLRVCHNVWPNEVKKWDDFNHLKVAVLHGTDRDVRRIKDADIAVINPEGIEWLSRNVPSMNAGGMRWMLVCDESTLFKNHTSMRFRALKKMLNTFKRRVILTGTPVPNGLLQLWSQIYILDVGERLSTFVTHYKNEFFIPVGWNGYGMELKPGAEQRIYNLINDIVMHKSQDELDLPPLVNNIIECTLPPKLATVYKTMKKDFFAEWETSSITALNAAAKGAKLKQIANGCIYDEDKAAVDLHSLKLDVVKELVEELSGRPLLVIYEHLCDLTKLLKAFPMARFIGGGSKNDDNTIALWNAGELPLLFLQPQAGGHGLNLQESGCHDIAWFSIPFDLELYSQAIGRVHRQGVRNSVTVHHIVMKDTIDELIMRVLEGKSVLQDALLAALKK